MNKGIERSIRSLRGYLRKANSTFFEDVYGQSSYEYPKELIEYYIEKAFKELLILSEALNLPNTYNQIKKLYEEAEESKGGLNNSRMGVDEPYLIWPERIEDYIDALANIHDVESDKMSKTSHLIEVLRHAVYPITDSKVFGDAPKNEREVHLRLEAIVKCIYHDLIHKPALSKPIKNFIPDTGIPSLKTLIEYKFISSLADAKRVADEVLTDTRAYRAKEWNEFLFVIYETRRVKPEKEWKQLLRACGTARDTDIIVLSGERPKKGKRTVKKK